MRYQGIKVTLVTGFLGAGKTTLIRHLLEQSPPHERWAVLVNEFGDIGLDSAFYADLDIAITEVPGGCVCCTTSAAFQKGLNQLIRQHNPDRIFIEPSGLGHPKQIIQKLRSPTYHDVLLLTGTFCVLDARHLSDERYTKHTIFNDQIASANGIVFSHVDQYTPTDLALIDATFSEYSQGEVKPAIFLSDPMALSENALDVSLSHSVVYSSIRHKEQENEYPHSHSKPTPPHESHHAVEPTQHDQPLFLQQGFAPQRHYHKQQDGMQVVGWQWSKTHYFDADAVTTAVNEMLKLDAIYRIKGVFVTQSGQAIFVNAARGALTTSQAMWPQDSRLEIIGAVAEDWLNVIVERYADLF